MNTVKPPRVDLVVATVGRTEELARFLRSLSAQSYPDLRVILVDQNADERLSPLLAEFDDELSILRLSSAVGLSRARNEALPHLAGDIVGFPDDDCWYPPNLLHDIASRFESHPDWDGISVQARDRHGQRSSMLWDTSAGTIGRYNVWRRAISFSFFLRRSVVSTVGAFAEDLGLGSGTPWQSGEESDYLLRALSSGSVLHYEPSLYVGHESPQLSSGKAERRNAYLRGVGHGVLLRRHRYPPWFAAFRASQLIVGSAAMLVTARPKAARYYFAMGVGRARGWFAI